MSVNKFFSNYFIEKTSLQLKMLRINEEFGDLPVGSTQNNIIYSLHRFASTRPLCYINRDTTKSLIKLFSENADHFLNTLKSENVGITSAVFSLLQKAPSWNIEIKSDSSTPNGIRDFELIWHPEYVRYFEHVYRKLIRVPLGIMECKNNKKLRDANINAQIESLEKNGLKDLSRGCSKVMRNAISHGKVYYEGLQIKYVDTKETEVLYSTEVLRNFDHLIENCHAVIISILIALNNLEQVSSRLLDLQLPFGIIFLVADGIISHDDFQFEYAYENIIQENTKQLHVACKTGSLGRATQITHAINVAWKFQMFFKSYDRYAFSIECGRQLPNSLFLNGVKLQEAINNDVDLPALQSVIDTNMLWFGVSTFKNKMHYRKVFIRVLWRLMKKEYVNNLKEHGWRLHHSRYEVRNVENRSAGKIRRVKAQVLLTNKSNDYTQIRHIIRHVVKKLRKKRLPALHLGRVGVWKRKPNYVWVDFFSENKSLRSYEGHMFSSYYVFGAEWIRKKKDIPILIKSPDMIVGKTRIKLNQKSDQITVSANKNND